MQTRALQLLACLILLGQGGAFEAIAAPPSFPAPSCTAGDDGPATCEPIFTQCDQSDGPSDCGPPQTPEGFGRPPDTARFDPCELPDPNSDVMTALAARHMAEGERYEYELAEAAAAESAARAEQAAALEAQIAAMGPVDGEFQSAHRALDEMLLEAQFEAERNNPDLVAELNAAQSRLTEREAEIRTNRARSDSRRNEPRYEEYGVFRGRTYAGTAEVGWVTSEGEVIDTGLGSELTRLREERNRLSNQLLTAANLLLVDDEHRADYLAARERVVRARAALAERNRLAAQLETLRRGTCGP